MKIKTKMIKKLQHDRSKRIVQDNCWQQSKPEGGQVLVKFQLCFYHADLQKHLFSVHSAILYMITIASITFDINIMSV